MAKKKCPVFICYRQVDGTKIAQWLYENLNGQHLPDIGHVATEEEVSSLDVYFDQTAPAVSDWKAIHQPRLRTSQAMIIVCTPGAFQKLEKDDWVHREIDWWLKNRKVAPILIDATGEGERWVPKAIKDRWPDAQRIKVVQDDLLRLQGQELHQFVQQVRSRILNGIVLSKEGFSFENLEQQKKQKKMSRRLKIALVIAIIALLCTVLAAILMIRTWDSESENERIAHQLAAQSELARNQHASLLPRSVLLAVESMKRYPSLEGDIALRQGLALFAHPIAVLSHEKDVSSVTFSPDGEYLATASDDHTACMWEATSGKEVARMNHGYVYSVAFSPDGNYLATASGDNTARVWEVTSGKQVTCMNHENSVVAVAFSPDGKYLATASWDNTTRIWEATSGKELARMDHDDEEPVCSVAFSPNGKYLATASEDDTAWVWEATSGQEVARMDHDGYVESVAFSPDGKYLATASGGWTGGIARVWEATSGKEVARMNHELPVRSIAFSPDGKYLATASDNTARVCFLWPDDLIAEACSRLTRNLTYAEWQQYLPDEPYSKTCPNLPIHPSFIEAGRDLARSGDIKGAAAIFRRAVELEPALDLDPEAEAQKLSSEAQKTATKQ